MRNTRLDGNHLTGRITSRWAATAFIGVAAVALMGSCEPYQPAEPDPPIAAPTPTPTPSLAPTPDPNATPASCPPLTRWSSGIHNITDHNSRVIPWPLVGGHVVVDSTPLFNGRACNAEKDNCGGRKCEDPRGGVWTLLEGESPSQPRGEGYQFRIGPLAAGNHRWRVCPRPDAMDPQGVPLVTGQHACTEGVFTPLLEPPTE